MKKLMLLNLMLLMVLLSSISAFAGDVPEQLLYEDTAQVFIGTVENYTTKEKTSSPYIEIETLECIPTEKIKGDVELGVKQSYQKCYCSIDFKPDAEYLFGYFDNNNIYIYEIESREDDKFKLIDSNIHDMTKRLESALNDGTFEKAEKQRIAKNEQAKTSSTSVIGGAVESKDTFGTGGIIGISAAVIIVLIIGILWMIKKKFK